MSEQMKDMDDVPDSVKAIKKAFGTGCAIAAFALPILAVWALFRRPSSSS